MDEYKYAIGNVIFNKWSEFIGVIIIQIISVVGIPFAIHNIVSFILYKINARRENGK